MNATSYMPDDRDSNRPYSHTIQSVHPEYQRRESAPPEKDDEPMPSDPPKDRTDIILAKLESLASAELLRKMQGQQVEDKREILASIDSLRKETRSEVASIRASLDVTNTAVAGVAANVTDVTARVKKLEILRSMPPRSMSPMPQRFDLGLEKTTSGDFKPIPPVKAEELVTRLNELEEKTTTLEDDVHVMSVERDRAKEAEERAKADAQKAQERQAIITTYAAELEKKAKDKEKETKDKEKALALEAAHRRKRLFKIAGALVPILTALGGLINHFLHW